MAFIIKLTSAFIVLDVSQTRFSGMDLVKSGFLEKIQPEAPTTCAIMCGCIGS